MKWRIEAILPVCAMMILGTAGMALALDEARLTPTSAQVVSAEDDEFLDPKP